MLRARSFVVLLCVSVAMHGSPSIARDDAVANAQARGPALVGTWEVVEEQEIDADGEVARRDPEVKGLLVYTPEGRMSVQLIYGHRPQVSTKDEDASTGLGLGHVRWSAEAARATIDTYDAYFGTYEVDPAKHIVVHRALGDLRPYGVGERYERRYELDGQMLRLRSTDPKQRWRVVFRRVQ